MLVLHVKTLKGHNEHPLNEETFRRFGFDSDQVQAMRLGAAILYGDTIYQIDEESD